MSGADAASAFAPLRDARFARLFAARFISPFGSQLTAIAMAFAVIELTGDPVDVATVVFAQTASFALVVAFGGALADRWDRRRVIVGAESAAGLVQATTAALLFSGDAQVWQLACLAAANGFSLALAMPAIVGLVPRVVARPLLQRANALLSFAHSAAFLAGGGAAGAIVAFAGGGSNVRGAGIAIGVDALSFFATALLVVGVRAEPLARSESAPAPSLVRELREGFSEFVAHRWLWTIVAQWTVVLTGYLAGLHVIGPIVAERSLGGAAAWGQVAASLGLGLVVGGLAALRLRVRRPMLVGTLFVFTFATPLALLAIEAPVRWVAAGAFAAGFGGELFSVLWATSLQTHVAPDKLSRVSAYDTLGSIGLAPLGQLGAGVLVGAIGAPATLWACVALVVVPTSLVLLVPEVRRLEMGDVPIEDSPPSPAAR